MAGHPITLDHADRRLLIKAPGERNPNYWVFLLEERDCEPIAIVGVRPDLPPVAIAKVPRAYLYNRVSNSWLDEHWEAAIEPLIVAIVEEHNNKAC